MFTSKYKWEYDFCYTVTESYSILSNSMGILNTDCIKTTWAYHGKFQRLISEAAVFYDMLAQT